MARTLKPEDQIAHYRVVSPLGAGGTGEVYRATDQSLERNVALKVLPPELVQSEERDAALHAGNQVGLVAQPPPHRPHLRSGLVGGGSDIRIIEYPRGRSRRIVNDVDRYSSLSRSSDGKTLGAVRIKSPLPPT